MRLFEVVNYDYSYTYTRPALDIGHIKMKGIPECVVMAESATEVIRILTDEKYYLVPPAEVSVHTNDKNALLFWDDGPQHLLDIVLIGIQTKTQICSVSNLVRSRRKYYSVLHLDDRPDYLLDDRQIWLRRTIKSKLISKREEMDSYSWGLDEDESSVLSEAENILRNKTSG